MSVASTDTIRDAVYENRAFSLDTVSERAFAFLFRGLVYPQIWEDPVCDMAALELDEDDDIICIASGGCNVMSYLTAQPASLTAVDLSPWHVELNRLKLAAATHLPDHKAFYSVFGYADRPENVELLNQFVLSHLDAKSRAFWNGRTGLRSRKSMFARGFYRFGVLGAYLGAVHLVARLGRVDFNQLLRANTLSEQEAFFTSQIAPLYNSRFVKFLARRRASLFGLGIPPAQYDKLASDADGDIIPVLKERTRKLFCDFPIAENYFAWQAANRAYAPDGEGPVPPYLEERHFEALRSAAGRAKILNQSITDVLTMAPNGSKSVYVLLDAQDWMTDAQLNALWTQITRTARPGARVLFRTGGADDILPGRVEDATLRQWTYDTEASQTAFKTDRSAIYGGVQLYRKTA
ncbi:DUF3419 family protein [Ruegeria arenilitoris]|uniref:DUF3419 family protein n=1 Tax=Ruegeria arenilitoris TaxID=1173585 RepID=UPI001480F0E1|nr:DUF3419 family protein [Ruegeria arenilitoris]